ncbi:MAG: endonuclease/exonuclease/phosphatase family protein, partial [Bacteroidales bacterium]
LKRKIKELGRNAECVLVTGDLNISPENPAIKELLKPEAGISLKDSKSIALKTEGPEWSFHNFGKLETEKRPLIDYIFVSEGTKVNTYEVLFDATSEKYTSDHTPILSIIEF